MVPPCDWCLEALRAFHTLAPLSEGFTRWDPEGPPHPPTILGPPKYKPRHGSELFHALCVDSSTSENTKYSSRFPQYWDPIENVKDITVFTLLGVGNVSATHVLT